MSIGDKQIKLINYAKFFIKRLESSDIDSSLSSFCYFTSWSETPGFAKLKYWLKGWPFIFKFCTILLKNILAIASHAKYIEFRNHSYKDNYDTIVISWCFQENFQSDGSFNDRYFKENSKDLPNSYWVLISMDEYVPVNLNNNITVIKSERGVFKYDFFSFLKIFVSIVIDCRKKKKKLFHYLYFSSYFAKVTSLTVKKELKKNNYKAILLPYEAQPFQNNIFFEIKKSNKKIKTIGYLHSLNPLTSELVYRSGSPDLLLVHGPSQIDILKSKLNWPENKLHLTQSFRFRLDEKKRLSNKIFLPHSILKGNVLISEFRKFLINSPISSLPNFVIQNHPTAKDSKKHLYFIKELEKIIRTYKDRFSSNSLTKEISIFFGVIDVLETLEKGINVIHICSDPIFESYSEKIWENLKVKQLSKFVFQYNLTSLGKYIIFGVKKKMLYETLKNLYH